MTSSPVSHARRLRDRIRGHPQDPIVAPVEPGEINAPGWDDIVSQVLLDENNIALLPIRPRARPPPGALAWAVERNPRPPPEPSSPPRRERGAFAALQQEFPDLKCYENRLLHFCSPKSPCVVRTGSRVTLIRLSSLGITRIPAALAKFPDLETLELDDNCIREIPALPASLKTLDLHGNQLPALPDDLLDRLPELADLRVDQNDLTDLPAAWAAPRDGPAPALRTISVRIARNPLADHPDGPYAGLIPLLGACNGISFSFCDINLALIRDLVSLLQGVNSPTPEQAAIMEMFATQIGAGSLREAGLHYNAIFSSVVACLWPEIAAGLLRGEKAAVAGTRDPEWVRDRPARTVFLGLLRARPELVVDRWWGFWQACCPADQIVLRDLHARVVAASSVRGPGGIEIVF